LVEEKVQKEPKKPLLKDQYGDIIINKIDTYVEPVKQVKETRGETSINYFKKIFPLNFLIINLFFTYSKGTQNRYDFGDLSVDEESDDDQKDSEQKKEEEAFVIESKKKKNNNKQQKKATDDVDLDSLLEQFGVEVKNEEKKPQEKKARAPKVEKTLEEKKEEVGEDQTGKTAEEKAKKKKKKAAPQTTNKSSHINDLKRELLERKENLKKKEKKKGL